MTTEAVATPTSDKTAKKNGQLSNPGKQPRVVSSPNDVASLVLMQIDAVNAKKDDLTIAIKGLTDTTKQLVRAYAEHAKAIQKLQMRVQALEKEKQK